MAMTVDPERHYSIWRGVRRRLARIPNVRDTARRLEAFERDCMKRLRTAMPGDSTQHLALLQQMAAWAASLHRGLEGARRGSNEHEVALRFLETATTKHSDDDIDESPPTRPGPRDVSDAE